MIDQDSAILSIDAGGTFFKYALFSNEGVQLCDIGKIPVNSKGTSEEFFHSYENVFSAAKSICKLCGVGVSTPGPFDYANGISLMEHKFEAIYRLPLKDKLIKILGENIPFWFCSDSNAFLMGAIRDTNYQEHNCIGITIGTGLGFSATEKGKILTNPQGGPVDRLFCSPCRDGILEDYISGKGIVRLYRELGGSNTFADAKAIGEACKVDPIATQTYREAGVLLARGLMPMVEKYRAEVVLLGGQVSKSFELMEDGMKTILPNSILIEKAKQIDLAPLQGVLDFDPRRIMT